MEPPVSTSAFLLCTHEDVSQDTVEITARQVNDVYYQLILVRSIYILLILCTHASANGFPKQSDLSKISRFCAEFINIISRIMTSSIAMTTERIIMDT
jgi:hypothetical protein